MKSINLRKVGLILAGAVFAVAMAFNFHSALLSNDQVSGVSLEELVKVAMASEEEGSPTYQISCKPHGYNCAPGGTKYCNGDDC